MTLNYASCKHIFVVLHGKINKLITQLFYEAVEAL